MLGFTVIKFCKQYTMISFFLKTQYTFYENKYMEIPRVFFLDKYILLTRCNKIAILILNKKTFGP